MKKIFEVLPQWAIALLVLAVGILLLLLADPPVSVCRTQITNLQSRLTPFLYPDSKRKIKTKTGFQSGMEKCKSANSPGGCRELFDGIRKSLAELETLNNECWTDLASVGELTGALREAVSLMAQIAWGEKAPLDSVDKLAWFDAYHLNAYCEMKKALIKINSEANWSEFAVSEVQKQPQAGQLEVKEAWVRSLFSVSCTQYR